MEAAAQMLSLEGGVIARGVAGWLVAGALDGTLFAAAAWLATRTLLRRASGRLLAFLWLLVLLEFVLLRPVLVPTVLLRSVPLWPEHEHTLPPLAALATSGSASATEVVLLVYGCVVALLLARLLLRQRKLRRHIETLPLAEPAMLAQVRAAAQELAFQGLPEVRISAAPISPYTLGPWRPTLVLPRWLCQPGPQLEAVLLHELAHLQRRDHLFIWCERAVAISFFFWPPVHWVCAKLDEARELACDERALGRGRFSAVDYGQHLLAVVAGARSRRMPATLGMGRAGVRLERRIVRLLQGAVERSPSPVERLALTLLLGCAVFGVRPARELPLPLAEQLPAALPRAGLSAPLTSLTGDAASLMSIAEPSLPTCTLQSCGTQCSP